MLVEIITTINDHVLVSLGRPTYPNPRNAPIPPTEFLTKEVFRTTAGGPRKNHAIDATFKDPHYYLC